MDAIGAKTVVNGGNGSNSIKPSNVQKKVVQNIDFYKISKELKITDFDEKQYGHVAANRFAWSVTDAQIEAEIAKAQILDEVKSIPLDQAARWFGLDEDETAPLPYTEGTDDKVELLEKSMQGQAAKINDKVLEANYGNGKLEAPANSKIKPDYANFLDTLDEAFPDNAPNATEYADLKKMLRVSDFTKEQKQDLKQKMEDVSKEDFADLCEKFKDKFPNMDKAIEAIKNIHGWQEGEKPTPEQVAEQLGYINDALNNLPDGTSLDSFVSNELAKFNTNITQTNTMTNAKLRALQSGKEVGGDLESKIGEYQKQNIESFVTLKEAEKFKEQMSYILKGLGEFQRLLNDADRELTQTQRTIDCGDVLKYGEAQSKPAESQSGDNATQQTSPAAQTPQKGSLLAAEADRAAKAQKSFEKADEKADKAANKLGKKDQNKLTENEGEQVEADHNAKSETRRIKHSSRQDVADAAQMEAISANVDILNNEIKESIKKKFVEGKAGFTAQNVLEIRKLVNDFIPLKLSKEQAKAIEEENKDKKLKPEQLSDLKAKELTKMQDAAKVKFNCVAKVIKDGTVDQMKDMLKWAKDLDITGLNPSEVEQLVSERFIETNYNADAVNKDIKEALTKKPAEDGFDEKTIGEISALLDGFIPKELSEEQVAKIVKDKPADVESAKAEALATVQGEAKIKHNIVSQIILSKNLSAAEMKELLTWAKTLDISSLTISQVETKVNQKLDQIKPPEES